MTKRSDIHRPGAIVPSAYVPVLQYSLATTDSGWPVPSDGVNCELDRRYTRVLSDGSKETVNGEHSPNGKCCVIGMRRAGLRFASTGGTGKCSVCGACYVYGEVWRHEPTDEHIHVGHDCARKYQLFSDDPEWCAQLASLKQRRAAFVEKCRRDAALVAAYAETPGLEDALAVNHRISQDLAAKLHAYGSLSPAQIALAFKLQADAMCPARPAETHVPAPEGRIKVRGVLVSKKEHESMYGITIKCTVKVTTPEGTWLAWGTMPAALLDVAPAVGATVEFTATCKRGRDAHFALFSRPTGGTIVAVKVT